MTANLSEIAHHAMTELGFIPDFPKSVLNELTSIQDAAKPRPSSLFRDQRERQWISIDNDDSKDLDQLTFAERTKEGNDKLFVAIADVDALVKSHSEIDKQAGYNTTSVYTPTKIFPMLPPKLSTGLTSLNENSDRCAVVIEMDIGKEGQFTLSSLYPSLVRNHAKLAYNSVAAWLDQKTSLSATFDRFPGLLSQLQLQDELAQRIKKFRYRQGTLTFGRAEIEPIIVNERPVELKETIHNRAHALIENCMIAANAVVTKYLLEQKLPVLKRIVEIPKRWDRIVALANTLGEKLPPHPDVKALRDFLQKQRSVSTQMQFSDLSLAIIKLIGKGEYVVAFPGKPSPGHFDLGLQDYAHTTAPNRRYPDLIMQRLLKSHFYGEAIPYNENELTTIAIHCTQKEDDAAKVERHTRKSAVAMLLSSQIGHEFEAMVTGASEKGTWVRLAAPPIEGKLVQGYKGLDVGDHLKVKLIHVDIPKGYIDFARI